MPTRSETVKLRLTSQELELYKERAGAFGMTLSDWIRSRCGQPDYSPAGVTEQIEEKLWAEHNKQLDGLAQIDKMVSTLSAPPTTTGAVVYESEKPLARSRKELCPHRRKPDEYCVKCDR